MSEYRHGANKLFRELHAAVWMTNHLLQCFDTVGWVIRPAKTVGRITYIVLAQT